MNGAMLNQIILLNVSIKFHTIGMRKRESQYYKLFIELNLSCQLMKINYAFNKN